LALYIATVGNSRKKLLILPIQFCLDTAIMLGKLFTLFALVSQISFKKNFVLFSSCSSIFGLFLFISLPNFPQHDGREGEHSRTMDSLVESAARYPLTRQLSLLARGTIQSRMTSTVYSGNT